MDKLQEIARLTLALELVSECAGLADIDAVSRLVGDRLRWLFDFDTCVIALRIGDGVRWQSMRLGDEGLSTFVAATDDIAAQQALAQSALESGSPAVTGQPMLGIAYPLGNFDRTQGALCIYSATGYAHRDLRYLHYICSAVGAALLRIGQGQQLASARDLVSEQDRAARDEASAANRAKDDFLAMLAHELRNPLAPISAAAELLQIGKLDGEQIRKTSQVIGRQVKHMISLVDDLLDVSRVTQGLVDLDKTPLDVGQLVTDAIEQVAPLIQSRRHQLTVQLTPEATIVNADRKRLVQVIANILHNAAKYTPEGGRILLATEVRGAHVLIEVSDNGVGMSPEVAARAFDLFVQAERTSDRSLGGLGIGLALVKSLVGLHGGQVSCLSEGMGKGSRFIVCLQRLPAQDLPDAEAIDRQGDQERATSLRILVVDDNVDAATTLAMLLEALGHQVFVEYDSRSALARARLEAPQVCLIDIGLPEIDGNKLARQLRSQPETARSLLIAVTGYGSETDRQQTLDAGFDHHVVKPVHIDDLTALLCKPGRS